MPFNVALIVESLEEGRGFIFNFDNTAPAGVPRLTSI
jgi:hypothetical protein